jgi:2'-5' RNA ligase
VDAVARRLFFALWPDDEVRVALYRPSSRVRLRHGRWVRPENLHVTLVFLGAVDAAQRACVEAAADAIRGRSFTLLLDRSGWWRRPQVLWAGASEIPEPALELVKALQAGCEACGFEREARAFRVHATLARKVVVEPPPLELPPVPWQVRGFVLVESTLAPGGSDYRVVRTWPLAAG